MASYQIISSAGADMGTYEAHTPEGAVEAMWDDAGVSPEARTGALRAELRVIEVTYGVGTEGGGVIADRLTYERAMQVAQEEATDRGETLYVWRSGQAGGPDDVAVEPEADEAEA